VPVYGHVVCGGCSIMLMYPVGAQSVKCSVCHFVTPAPPGGGVQPPPAPAPQQAAAGGPGLAVGQGQAQGQMNGLSQPAVKPAGQTVVIENPPSLDANGHEVGRRGAPLMGWMR
jgi:LSD1 subclass zinc finger protein